ncbi:MAG: hypothetical protein A2054_09235 [Deltaproteobacteria bacterium GWA2_55_10]|nr:MAG: hypothetical protein A2054_09235 [Deltaproteobacteria bacterium GWA2_55_10]
MKKALIIIGGSTLQLPAIRRAKELGLYTVVTDRNADAPGRAAADRFVLLDGTDVEGFIRVGEDVSRSYRICGAFAGSDFGLPAVAALNGHFRLPGASALSVRLALDKSLSKDIWIRKGICTPAGAIISGKDDLRAAVERFGFPVILKPVNASGSRGIRSAADYDELDSAYESARGISGKVLAEKLLHGTHLDVNGVFHDGGFHECGILERMFSPPPFHYPVKGVTPPDYKDCALLYSLLERSARALGITGGPVKGDVIVTKDGPFIIELAPRFHGEVSTSFVLPLAGMDPVRAWFESLNGGKEFKMQKGDRAAGWAGLFPNEGGRVASVSGLDEAAALEGVSVMITRKPGEVVKKPADNTALCGFVWAAGQSREQALASLDKACSFIRFETETEAA